MEEEQLEAYKTQFAERETWSVEDLAELLGRPKSWVLSLLDEGKIPYRETTVDEGGSGYEVKGKALAVALLESPELQARLEADEPSPTTRPEPAAEDRTVSRGPTASLTPDDSVGRRTEDPGREDQEHRGRIEELEAENRRIEERNRRLAERVDELELQLEEAVPPDEVERIREEGRQEVLEKINTFSNLLANRIEAWMEKDTDSAAGIETLINLMQPTES